MRFAKQSQIKKWVLAEKPEQTKKLTYFRRNLVLYIMIAFPIVILFIFNYIPIYGIVIAFKHLIPGAGGFYKGDWVGLIHFERFIKDNYFWQCFKNTFLLGLYSILFGFPAPIILALLFNEIKFPRFKKTVQTISYLPNFVSMVAICGIIINILSPSVGIINKAIEALGLKPVYFMTEVRYFRSIYVISGVWQGAAWGSILYTAALSGVNMELYESAITDGANRFQKIWHISIPAIRPTISIMFILSMPGIISANFEKVLLLYNSATMPVADILPTYIYRMGLMTGNYEFATAIGLFNSLLFLAIVFATNRMAGRHEENATLW